MSRNRVWMSKKRKLNEGDEESDSSILPLIMPNLASMMQSSTVYSHQNHVYFNSDVTSDSMFALNRELRNVEHRQQLLAMTAGCEPGPIYLHLTTDGGTIHDAFSAVDCIQSLKVPVYTVVDGFVASAGTLISLAGDKRYIRPNAYMLIHELRSGVWGKMSAMEEEMGNLKKLMEHLTAFYVKHSKLTKKQLEKIFTKDLIWNAKECLDHGVIDEVMTRT